MLHIQDFLSIRTGGTLQIAEGKYKYIQPRLLRLGAAVTQERIPAKLDAAYHPKYDSTRNHIAADAYMLANVGNNVAVDYDCWIFLKTWLTIVGMNSLSHPNTWMPSLSKTAESGDC